jgi:hypothetical protein
MNTSVFVVRLVGGLGLVVLAISAWATLTGHFAGGVKRPVLAMELAASTQDVRNLLAPQGNVDQMRHQITVDWFFIAGYWLFFLGVAGLLAAQAPAASRWNAGLAALLATGTALFDLRENCGILRSLDAFPGGGPSLEVVRDTREASLLKWMLLFVLLLLLSQLFAWRPDWLRWVGVALAAGGLLGLVGLAWQARQALITAGFLLAFAGLGAAMVCWLFQPAVFLAQR